MKLYQFDYTCKDMPTKAQRERLHAAHTQFEHAFGAPYTNGYSVAHVPFDSSMQQYAYNTAQEKKNKNPRMLLIIGIGGSNLGTKAIHEYLNGLYYNDTQPSLLCYFIDTLDVDALRVIIDRTKQILKAGQEIIINIISKSGSTIETIVNFNLFLTILKKYRPLTYHEYVVVTTDKDSALSYIALKKQYTLLPLPVSIGGRYSVFTSVGLFPLAMLGIDTNALCKGAQTVTQNMQKKVDNEAAHAAFMNYYYCVSGYNVHDMFVFAPELHSFGLWYRQLVGESLGKDKKRGITPTVSVGSTDLHSVGQLYLGGPYDKYGTFVTTNQKIDYNFSMEADLESSLYGIKSSSIQTIMNGITQGTTQAYKADKRPFESLHIIEKREENIGAVLQWYMMRIVYLAHLLEVDPFDQPHVELYKEKTREILRDE